MNELQTLQAIHDLLEYNLSVQGFGLGLGLGITTAGGWLLVLLLRRVWQTTDKDE